MRVDEVPKSGKQWRKRVLVLLVYGWRMLIRSCVLNIHAAVFVAGVFYIGVLLNKLPMAACASFISTMCMHRRLPYSHNLATCYARLIACQWPSEARVSGLPVQLPSQQTMLVVEFSTMQSLSKLSRMLVCWAFVLNTLDKAGNTAPLMVVGRFPDICNAPFVRSMFHVLGFVDYTAESVAQYVQSGANILVFDTTQLSKQQAPSVVHLDVQF